MKTPLRILHLEDDPKDAELIRATLEAAGFAPEIVVVQTKADYLAQFDHGWELILADYKLPEFDGLQALALFKERGLDISFILISGTLGEEAVVAALHAGASDYILKTHLARLGPAVERGLRETVERRARKAAAEALQASEGRWRFALEGAGDGVWDWDVPASTVFFSKRWKDMFGYTDAEIGTGLDEWSSRVHPEDMPRVMADLQPHLDGQTAGYANEHRMRCKDGSYKWVLDRGLVITRDPAGKPLRVVGTHTDITERKYGEDERLRNLSLLQMMSSASPMGYLVVDNRTDEIRFFNKRFCEIWGIEHLADRLERGELKNRDIIPDCLPMLADVPAFAASCVPLQFEASRVMIEDEIPFTAGRMIRRYSTQLRGADDRYYGRFYLFEDVTRVKQAERRAATHSQTMTALAAGAPLAEVLTTLVRGVEAEHPGTLGSVLLLDAAGTHLLTGAAPSLPAFYNDAIHGVAIGPAVGSCGTAVFTGERVLVADIQTDPLWTDYKALAAQAGLAACWSEPIRGTRGRVVGSFAFYHAQPCGPNEVEIGTIVAAAQLAAVAIERTQAEKALRESEQKFHSIVDAEPECVKLLGENCELLEMNPAGLQMIAAGSMEQVRGLSVLDLVDPKYHPLFSAGVAAVFRGETTHQIFEIIALDGQRRWMELHAVPLWEEQPTRRVKQMLAVTRDITERKHTEAELAKAHKELIDSSRRAGMAEVATGVLHNVGNVLNSVNVSATLLNESVRKSPQADLTRVVTLLREQGDNLGAFFTRDPRGPKVPLFLAQLADKFARQQETQLKELESLVKNIGHIKSIVAMQQSFAKVSGVTETLEVTELVEDTLRMNADSFQKHEVELVREFAADLPAITTDKHKVLQILVNLIRNARHACDDARGTEKKVTVRVTHGEGRVKIQVSDNGMGIPAENLNRVFNHGFTTKKDGHGFGLHSGANAAKELGGSLTVQSDGPGHGATFTLELAAEPACPANAAPARLFNAA